MRVTDDSVLWRKVAVHIPINNSKFWEKHLIVITYPIIVLHSGFNNIWASDVIINVISIPLSPCTKTGQARKQIHTN